MSKDIEWLKNELVKLGNLPAMGDENFNEGYWKAYDDFSRILKQLNDTENVKVPPFVETYLSDGAFGNYSLADKVGYLVQSHSGDNYYLTDMLVEENFISETMGQMLFEYATNESIENLLDLINGHEVLEEKAEITISSPYRDDKKVTLNKDEAIEFVKEWFN